MQSHGGRRRVSGESAGTPSTGLDLPGMSGNYLSVPDSADLDITGNFACMTDGALDDWTPAVQGTLAAKYGAAGQRSWRLLVLAAGTIRFVPSGDGTTIANSTSSAAPVVANGAFLCVGVTYRVSDQRVQFFTAPTGTATHPGGAGWLPLGTDQTNTQTSIFNSTAAFEIGTTEGGTLLPLAAVFKRVQVWASIDGSDKRLDVNLVGQAVTATRTPATITEAAKSATATINGSAWDWTTS